MDKALGFYPRDAGSIPAGGTILNMNSYFIKTLLVLQRFHINNIHLLPTEMHRNNIYTIVLNEVDYELHRERRD